MLHKGFHLDRLRSRMTEYNRLAYSKRKWSNTVRCKSRFSSFFSSLLFSVSSRYKKTEKQKLWSEGSNGGRQRDEEHPSSDTNCCEWGRPPVRKRSHNNLSYGRTCVWEMWKNVIRTHTHTHTHTKRYISIIKSATVTNEQPTLTKGYKVTLYSDSLRATALYAIYTNGPNLG